MYIKGCEDPVGCTVRVHDENRMIGDVKGTSFDFSERHENTPQAIFLLEEFDPCVNESFQLSGLESFRDVICRGAIIRVQDDPVTGPAAYEIDNVDPVHGITQNAALVRVDRDEIVMYPAPPDEPVCPPTS